MSTLTDLTNYVGANATQLVPQSSFNSFVIGGTSIVLSVGAADASGNIPLTATLAGSGLAVTGLAALSTFLPASGGSLLALVPGLQLPSQLTLSQLIVTVNPSAAVPSAIIVAIHVDVSLGSYSWQPGNLGVSLSAVHLLFDLANPLSGNPSPTLTINGNLTLGDAAVPITCSVNPTASGNQPVVNLALAPQASLPLAALNAFLPDGVSIPAEVPSISLTAFSLGICAGTTPQILLGATGTASGSFPFVSMAPNAANVTATLSLTLPFNQSGTLSGSLQLTANGPVEPLGGLILKSLALTYAFGPSSVSATGTATLNLFDAPLTFAAAVTSGSGARTMTLTLAPVPVNGIPLLSSLPSTIGSLSCQSVGLTLTTSPSGNTYALSATGILSVGSILTVGGNLSISSAGGSQSISFTAANGATQLNISLPIPGQSVRLALALNSITIGHAATNGWSFAASGTLTPSGMPRWLSGLLASPLPGNLKVDGSGISVSLPQLFANSPASIPLPTTNVGTYSLALGSLAVSVSNFTISLGQSVQASVTFGLGLPAGLNNIFGVTSSGAPAAPIFNTYNPTTHTGLVHFQLSIDSAAGVSIQLLDSPIAALSFSTQGASTICNLNLGQFGACQFSLPIFSYDGAKFSASGSFTQTSPLQLPLTPLKLLLNACGLSSLASGVPSGLPLPTGLSLLNSDGTLNTDQLCAFLQSLDPQLNSAMTQPLAVLSKAVGSLPQSFQQYLNFTIPASFNFNISVTDAGSVTGTISVPSGVRLLTWNMGPAGLPEFIGINLTSLSIGEAVSGSLGTVSVSATIDQFDPFVLAAAVGLGGAGTQIPYLPKPQLLSRQLVINNLFMLIVYETVIPIPVPLTCDRIDINYYGIEGFQLQASLSLPAPTLSAQSVAQLISQFGTFLTSSTALLDPAQPPSGMNIAFTLGPIAVVLPPYLGGTTLVSMQAAPLSSYPLLAHALNAAKTLNLNELIQSVPISDRTGSVAISFASMALNTSWLITTPAQFIVGDYAQLGIPSGQTGSLVQLLPGAAAGSAPPGLVTFLHGAWQIGNGALSLDTWFGLIGTSAGFATAFAASGTINNLINIALSGQVAINPQGPQFFSVAGQTTLSILNTQVLSGTLSVTNNSLAISGNLNLFPSSALTVSGTLNGTISNSALSLGGNMTVSLGSSFTLANAQGSLTQNGLTVSGTWMGQTLTFSAVNVNGSMLLQAALGCSLGSGFSFSGQAQLGIGSGTPSLTLNGNVTVLGAQASTAIVFANNKFSFSVNGQRIFGAATANLTCSGTGPFNADKFQISATLGSDFWTALSASASSVLTSTVSTYNAQVSSAQSQVNQVLKPAITGFQSTFDQALNVAETVASYAGPSQAVAQQALATLSSSKKSVADNGENALLAVSSFVSQVVNSGSAIANAASFVGSSTGSPIQVLSASFAGSLNAVQAGQVSLNLGVSFLGGPTQYLTVSYDFANPAAGAKMLAQSLVQLTQQAAPHIDLASIPLTAVPAIAHLDVPASPHTDTAATLHVDIPHADFNHGDATTNELGISTHWDISTGGVHVDTAHQDTSGTPHADVNTPHLDTPSSPELKSDSIAHGDVAAVPVPVVSKGNIVISGGVTGSARFLNVPSNGSGVNLSAADDGTGHQQWTLLPLGDGTFNILVGGGVSGGLSYLSGSSQSSSVSLVAKDDGSGRQRWRILFVGDGSFNIWLSGGGFGNYTCLSTRADGSLVDLYNKDDGSGRQRWVIGGLLAPLASGNISISGGVTGGNRLLSVPYDGSSANLYAIDDGTGHQRWSIKPVGDGTFNIIVGGGITGGLSYLSASGQNTRASLVAQDDGSGRQRWRFSLTPEGAVNIILSGGGFGNYIYLSTREDGSLVDLYNQEGIRQRWVIGALLVPRLSGPIMIAGGVAGKNLLLSVPNQGSPINLYSSDDGAGHQRWSLVPVGDGTFNILVGGGVTGGLSYLSASGLNASTSLVAADDGSGRQRWRLQSTADGAFNILLSGGGYGNYTYLSTRADGSLVDLYNQDDGSGRQRWHLPAQAAPRISGNIKIAGGVSSNKRLLSVPSDGSKADLYTIDDGTGHQRWSIVPAGDGLTFYIIVGGGIFGQGKYLSGSATNTSVGLSAVDDGSGRQRWLFLLKPDGSFNIQLSGSGYGNYNYLSTCADGSLVDLYNQDDGSGRQRWLLPKIGGN